MSHESETGLHTVDEHGVDGVHGMAYVRSLDGIGHAVLGGPRVIDE